MAKGQPIHIPTLLQFIAEAPRTLRDIAEHMGNSVEGIRSALSPYLKDDTVTITDVRVGRGGQNQYTTKSVEVKSGTPRLVRLADRRLTTGSYAGGVVKRTGWEGYEGCSGF